MTVNKMEDPWFQCRASPYYDNLLIFMFLYSLSLFGFFFGVFQVLMLISVLAFVLKKRGILLPKSLPVFLSITLLFVVVNILVNSSDSAYTSSLVSDLQNRNILTMGSYESSGDISWPKLLRYIVYVYMFLVMKIMFARLSKEQHLYVLKRFLFFCAFCQLMIMLLSEVPGGVSALKWAMGQGIPGGPSNFLSTDDFGLRFSIGLYEPSHMSVVIGTAAVGVVVIGRSAKDLVFALSIVTFFFLTSRSLAVFVCFFMAIALMEKRVLQVLAILGTLVSILMVDLINVDFYAIKQFDQANLFRSIAERTLIPELHRYEATHYLFGTDFGRSYTMIPVLNQVLIFGIVYSVLFAIFVLRSLQVILLALLVFFVSPQPWYVIPWVGLGFLESALAKSTKTS